MKDTLLKILNKPENYLIHDTHNSDIIKIGKSEFLVKTDCHYFTDEKTTFFKVSIYASNLAPVMFSGELLGEIKSAITEKEPIVFDTKFGSISPSIYDTSDLKRDLFDHENLQKSEVEFVCNYQSLVADTMKSLLEFRDAFTKSLKTHHEQNTSNKS